jgi:hypothetical protein
MNEESDLNVKIEDDVIFNFTKTVFIKNSTVHINCGHTIEVEDEKYQTTTSEGVKNTINFYIFMFLNRLFAFSMCSMESSAQRNHFTKSSKFQVQWERFFEIFNGGW